MCEICGNNESRTLNHSRRRPHLLKLFKVMRQKIASGYYRSCITTSNPRANAKTTIRAAP